MVPQILIGILISVAGGGVYFGIKEMSWREEYEKGL